MRTAIESISKKFDQAKWSVRLKTGTLKLSYRIMKKIRKSEESPHDLWNTIKRNNLWIIEVLK